MKKTTKVFSVFFLLLPIIFYMFFVFNDLHGKSEYREGTDKNIITARFPDSPDFSKCFYRINIISAGGIGPTRSRINVMCLLNDDAVENLQKQYNWDERELNIEDKFYNRIGISNSISWYYNKEFSKKIMRGRFVGEAYFSITGKCIYIEADD